MNRNTETVIKAVCEERERQDRKWGKQDHVPVEWIAILTEEIGEASKEALEHHWPMHYAKDPERLRRLRKELIQVAAVAVAAAECLDRNELA